MSVESKDLDGHLSYSCRWHLSTTEARTWRTFHGSKILHTLGDGRLITVHEKDVPLTTSAYRRKNPVLGLW